MNKLQNCIERNSCSLSFQGRVDMAEKYGNGPPFDPPTDWNMHKIEKIVKASNWSLDRVWWQPWGKRTHDNYFIYMFCNNDGSKEFQLFTVVEHTIGWSHSRSAMSFYHIPYQETGIRLERWFQLEERVRKEHDIQKLTKTSNEQREEIEQLNLIIDQLKQEMIAADDEFAEERNQNNREYGIASCTVGAFMLVIGYFVVALKWKANKEMSEEMREELTAQRERILTPHELVPVVPSVHANRLGVHEHPAVRDVFGMKEPWDVTPGEGFHVAYITAGYETTRGMTAEGTDEGADPVPVVLDDEGQ